MSILAYGLNHRTASLDLRERVAFSPEDLDRTLQALTSEVQGIEEAAIISTCNRTEIYCATDASREEDISHWLTDTRPVTLSELKGASYGHWDQDAARHAIRVASGLDKLDELGADNVRRVPAKRASDELKQLARNPWARPSMVQHLATHSRRRCSPTFSFRTRTPGAAT